MTQLITFDPDLIDFANADVPEGVAVVDCDSANPALVQSQEVTYQSTREGRGRRQLNPLVEGVLVAALCVHTVRLKFFLEALGYDHISALAELQKHLSSPGAEALYNQGRPLCKTWFNCSDASDFKRRITAEVNEQLLAGQGKEQLKTAALSSLKLLALAYTRGHSTQSNLYAAQPPSQPLPNDSSAKKAFEYRTGEWRPNVAQAMTIAIDAGINPTALWPRYGMYRHIFDAGIHTGRISRGQGTQLDEMNIYVLLRILEDHPVTEPTHADLAKLQVQLLLKPRSNADKLISDFREALKPSGILNSRPTSVTNVLSKFKHYPAAVLGIKPDIAFRK